MNTTILKQRTTAFLFASLFTLSHLQAQTDLTKRNIKGEVYWVIQIDSFLVDQEKTSSFTHYTYNQSGMLTAITSRYLDESGEVKFTYDEKNLLVKRITKAPKRGMPNEPQYRGEEERYFIYDRQKRLTESMNRATREKTKYSYNAKGLLETEQSYSSSGQAFEPIRYEYDERNRLVTKNSRGGFAIETYSYDKNNRLKEVCGDGFCKEYIYNEQDDPIEIIESEYGEVTNRQTITYTYDQLNNWTKRRITNSAKKEQTVSSRLYTYHQPAYYPSSYRKFPPRDTLYITERDTIFMPGPIGYVLHKDTLFVSNKDSIWVIQREVKVDSINTKLVRDTVYVPLRTRVSVVIRDTFVYVRPDTVVIRDTTVAPMPPRKEKIKETLPPKKRVEPCSMNIPVFILNDLQYWEVLSIECTGRKKGGITQTWGHMLRFRVRGIKDSSDLGLTSRFAYTLVATEVGSNKLKEKWMGALSFPALKPGEIGEFDLFWLSEGYYNPETFGGIAIYKDGFPEEIKPPVYGNWVIEKK